MAKGHTTVLMGATALEKLRQLRSLPEGFNLTKKVEAMIDDEHFRRFGNPDIDWDKVKRDVHETLLT